MSVEAERSFATAVLLLLAGPVIWFTHFMVVYVLGEVICTAGGPRFRALGMPDVTFLTLVLTIAAAALTLLLARRAHRRREGRYGEVAAVGALLGVLFTVAILFVGVPPVFLTPC